MKFKETASLFIQYISSLGTVFLVICDILDFGKSQNNRLTVGV